MHIRRVLVAVIFGVLSGCSGEKTTAPLTVSSVSLTNASGTLQYGQTVQLTASVLSSNGSALSGRPLTWSSSNDAIASVSSTGLVTAGAVRGGSAETATITVTSDGKSASAAVTVAPISVSAVAISLAQVAVYVGQTVQLGVTVKDVTGGVLAGRAVTWSSASPTIATVSTQGLVTAIATGAATITATVDSKSATASVTVLAPLTIGVGPQIAVLQMPSAQVGVAYSYPLTATGGDGRYVFTIVSGRLPTGLALSSSGLISGTATTSDSVDLRLRVLSAGSAGERSVRMLVVEGGTTSASSTCPAVWDVSSSSGGLLTLSPPTGSAGGQEVCVQLPASSTGRSLIILSPDTWAGRVGSAGDLTPPQIAYEVLASNSSARRAGMLASIPNPPARAPKIWPRITVPGDLRSAPAEYTWQWGTNRFVPSRLAYRGQYVNYYEDSIAAVSERGTIAEWAAIDSAVNARWAAMDTLFGPIADRDRDGKFAIVSITGVAGTNAYYSVCALAPGWSGAVRDTLGYNCGADKTRDHAVIPMVGRVRGNSSVETAERIVGPLLHETVHARQHMLTLQVPGRSATENRCGIVPYFRAKPASPPTECESYAPSIRSSMFEEGSANVVTTLLTDSNWRYGCLHSMLSGQCNLNDEPYHSGHLFWSWLIARAGRSLWTETLFAALSATTAIDALHSATGISEGFWYAMFLASMMLDDTSRGERLGLHWPVIPLAQKMGFSSTAAQWQAHPTIGVGSYNAVRLRYGSGTALRIDHTNSVTIRLRIFSGGDSANALIIPEVAR